MITMDDYTWLMWNVQLVYLSRLLPTTTSFNWTMFSCLHASKIDISRNPLTGKPSFSCSIRTFFKATIVPFFESLALSENVQHKLRIRCACNFDEWYSTTYRQFHMFLLRFGSAFRIQIQIGIVLTSQSRLVSKLWHKPVLSMWYVTY